MLGQRLTCSIRDPTSVSFHSIIISVLAFILMLSTPWSNLAATAAEIKSAFKAERGRVKAMPAVSVFF